ncbi:unnamed protein product [Schistosoma rodhaini]|nr:unnamed protein product [Schistosoma rodhaini]
MLGVFDVDLLPQELPHTTITSCLCSGSVFTGSQRSKGKKYNVEVTIQYVDMKQKMVYGFMKIENLTQEYPSLTTYFEGEIISRLHPFMTGKWDATMETDVLHWVFVQLLSVHLQEKIPATSSLGNFHIDSFDYSILETSDTIFMRWKEKFIVPDPGLKHIEGASFAGFYYIGLQKSIGHVLGYYYHLNSEMFQSLELKYKPESTPSIFQLR